MIICVFIVCISKFFFHRIRPHGVMLSRVIMLLDSFVTIVIATYNLLCIAT
nr:MAG TPA: hypothetical protein [Caudoviricetes sp.]